MLVDKELLCISNYVLYLVIALSSVAGMMVHGFVDTVFFRPQIQFIFWIMMGIIRVITVPKR